MGNNTKTVPIKIAGGIPLNLLLIEVLGFMFSILRKIVPGMIDNIPKLS